MLRDSACLLQDCSVEDIKGSIRMVASFLPPRRSGSGRGGHGNLPRANHTREKFAEEYRKVIGTIIGVFGHKAGCVDTASHTGLDDTARQAAALHAEQT